MPLSPYVCADELEEKKNVKKSLRRARVCVCGSAMPVWISMGQRLIENKITKVEAKIETYFDSARHLIQFINLNLNSFMLRNTSTMTNGRRTIGNYEKCQTNYNLSFS